MRYVSEEKEELRRLLALYRKGHISEEVFLEQMAELNGAAESAAAEDSEDAPVREEAAEPSLVRLLDGYRAAEASGAQTLEAWAGLTADARLAGGLRTMSAREAAHAFLLEVRIRELGGEPVASVPAWLAGYNKALLDPEASDLDRLAAVIAQFPDTDTALEPLERLIDSIEGDDLTRELLVTIGDDERATLQWFHAAFDARRESSGD
jgi:hypothetical protein